MQNCGIIAPSLSCTGGHLSCARRVEGGSGSFSSASWKAQPLLSNNTAPLYLYICICEYGNSLQFCELEYLWWSFAALVHRSVMWCQLSLRIQEGSGGHGSVSTCPTQCGTTNGGRGTVHYHSPTNANAEERRKEQRETLDFNKKKREIKDIIIEASFFLRDRTPRLMPEEEVAADTSSALPAGRMWCAGIMLHKRRQTVDITAAFQVLNNVGLSALSCSPKYKKTWLSRVVTS